MAKRKRWTKEEIAADLKKRLETEVVDSLVVNTLAWAYGVNYTTITPIIQKFVKSGLLYIKCKSGAGNNIYATA